AIDSTSLLVTHSSLEGIFSSARFLAACDRCGTAASSGYPIPKLYKVNFIYHNEFGGFPAILLV
ncbi:MAG: hypothetical protein ACOYM2_20845, partial [Rectinemataceae bacterium]